MIESGGIDLTGRVTYAGRVHVDAGAHLHTSAWSAPVTLTPSARFEGDGSVSFIGKVNGTLSGNAELAIELTGDLMVAPGSNVAIGRAFSGRFRLDGTLTNHGTLRWIENSDSSLPPGTMGRNTIAGSATSGLASRIINETDGLFDLQCGGELAATVSLDNHGTLRKSGGLAPAHGTWIAGAFTNDGTIEIPVSLLSISNPVSNAGPISVAAGATLQYSGASTGSKLLPGSAFPGAGTSRLTGRISGTLVGNATLSTQLTGDLVIAAGSTVAIGDSADLDFTLAGSLANHGTLLWRGGRILSEFGNPSCAIVNSASGIFDIQCNDSIDSAIAFTNQGTLRKTSEASTTTLDCAFTNSGTIEASTGELVFGRTFVQSKGAIHLAGGKLTKAAPFDLRLEGGELSGYGTIGGNLVASGAVVRPGDAVGSPLVIEGGLRIMPSGTVALTAPGTALHAGFLGVDAGATFAVQVSAVPVAPPVKLTGFALLDGNLNLSLGNGFIPALGSHLRLIDCASLTGTFAASSFPSQPAGASYSVAYGTNLVEVVVAGSTYEDWKKLHFGTATDPAIVGGTADPDGDGIANLLEYAFGLEPLAASRTGLPVVALQSATAGGPLHLTLTYTTPATVTDLSFLPEVSNTLADWQSGPGQTETVSDTVAAGIRTVVVRDTVPASTGTRRFMRLSVLVPAAQ